MKCTIKIFFTITIFTISILAQIGTTIPETRKVNWEVAGNNRGFPHNIFGLESPVKSKSFSNKIFVDTYITDPSNPFSVIDGIYRAIEAARIYAVDNRGAGSVIEFTKGTTYTIPKQIAIRTSNIILEGNGCTIEFAPKYNPDNKDQFAFIVITEGPFQEYKVDNYLSSDKNLKLDIGAISTDNLDKNTRSKNLLSSVKIEPGDMLEIYTTNSLPWSDLENAQKISLLEEGSIIFAPEPVLGQLVQVKNVGSNSNILLEDSIQLMLDIFNAAENSNSLEMKVKLIKKDALVKNVGFRNFKFTFRETSVSDNFKGSFLKFQYAFNSWVDECMFLKPNGNHLELSSCLNMEIRDSYFDNAHSHNGGFAYGVVLSGRTSNSLVENNIFVRLRHAIILVIGANRNVIGYNYSREQIDIGNYNKECLSLHGNYPYANLFEGNRVDQFGMDLHWGSNGPYNTFFRNYSYYKMIKMEWEKSLYDEDGSLVYTIEEPNNYYNLLGNEGRIYFSSHNSIDVTQIQVPSEVLELYGFLNGELTRSYSHTNYPGRYYSSSYLDDVSYYKKSKPAFIKDTKFSWPPIGPRRSSTSYEIKQNIPSRDRWCSNPLNYGTCDGYTDMAKKTETQDKIVKEYKLFEAYPNPFNPSASIQYNIKSPGIVSLKIYDILGNEVSTLVNEFKASGEYQVDFYGDNLSSGVYIYTLRINNFFSSKKMLLVK